MAADSKQNEKDARPDNRIFRDNETAKGKLKITFRYNRNGDKHLKVKINELEIVLKTLLTNMKLRPRHSSSG